MTKTGFLKKLKTDLKSPVDYFLCLDDATIPLNSFMGQVISLVHTGRIQCIQCHRLTHKSFQQGFCFPCFRRLQECHLCIIHPERCHVEDGTCSRDDWAHAHCGAEHFVYLANTSGLKVGVTRATQLITRWIDQGAHQAVALFKASNRYQAGIIEVTLKKFIGDKTNWRIMLKQPGNAVDLLSERDKLLATATTELTGLASLDLRSHLNWAQTLVTLQYPVLVYPSALRALSFEKTPRVMGKLLGLKGQYCILDSGVINIRKHNGYEIHFNSHDA